jgi:hypothetical protein
MSKLNIFISSTITDLTPERLAVAEAITQLRFAPGLLEYTGSIPTTAPEASVLSASKADVYILIVGARYGSVPPGETISVTEMEFNAAEKKGIPIFVYVKDVATREPDEDAFLERVRAKKLHGPPFKTLNELAESVKRDLAEAITNAIRARGWETQPAPVPQVLIASLGKSPGAVTALYHGLTERLGVKITQVVTIHPRGNVIIQGCVQRLRREFEMKSVAYDSQSFAGDDLRTSNEVLAFRIKIGEIIEQYRAGKGMIHLGIAGGRSSMGALIAMAARELAGHAQLYHLWVADDIEKDGEISNLVGQSSARQREVLFPPDDQYEIVQVPFIG